MTFLRCLFIVFGIVIYLYSALVVMREGLGLFAVYFNDLFALNWSGQFNLDFALYLMLSGLWLAWRSGFSTSGIVRGLIASVCGMLYFVPQVLVLMARCRGDLRGCCWACTCPRVSNPNNAVA